MPNRLSLLALLAVPACAFPQLDEECAASVCGTSTEPMAATTTDAGVQTVTGGDPAMTSVTSGETTSGTSGEPEDSLPAIVGFEVTPDPIKVNGPILLSVTAVHADGVRAQLDTGAVLELAVIKPGVFGAKIPVYSGLDNGSHVALLTPRRDGVSGATVEAPYMIALPEPGSQAHWETGNLIGQGLVAALATTPDNHVIELGTSITNDGTRCYMRRRDKAGAWSQSDVVQLFPGQICNAIDLVVDAQGVLSVLVNLEVGDGMRWRLARSPAWGAEPENRGFGLEKETAVALALHPSGEVAACGFGEASAVDEDAVAWIFPPHLPGVARAFDYLPNNAEPHVFSERTRDCLFVGDTLVLVGEAHGKHGNEDEPRDRLFIVRADVDAQSATWHVAPPIDKAQSGGQAAAVDDQGRLMIGAFVCDDTCQPEGELRIYDDADSLVYLAPLGNFSTTDFAVRDLAWSPAGYAVVVTGGLKGNDSAFTVRGFDPMKIEPVWTFARKDGGLFHTALVVALGKLGEVFAGGIGETSFPAFLIVNG